MRRTYDDVHVVFTAVKKHFQGCSFREVSSITGVPKSTIHYWVTRLGRVFEHKRSRRIQYDVKKKKRDQLRDDVLEQLQSFPFHTLASLKRVIQTDMSLSSLCRVVSDLRFSFKKVSWRTVPRNMELERMQFNDRVHALLRDGKHIVAVDETGFISNDMPTKGYSKTGSRLRPVMVRPRRTKASCVMAIDTMGNMIYDVHSGSVRPDDARLRSML